jgi:hypothetical protein
MAKEEKESPNKLQSETAMLSDAVKELTKAVTDMSKELTALKNEQEKLRKSGKF